MIRLLPLNRYHEYLRRLAVTLLFLIGLGVPQTAFAASDWCDVPQEGAGSPGQLSIGKFGIFGSQETCPPLEDQLQPPFTIINLNLVFRLEGDERYLASPRAAKPITALLRRETSDHSLSNLLTLHASRIDRASALQETRLKGGYFDWRFRVRFHSRIRPGTYHLTLKQEGQPICIVGGNCTVVFNIGGGRP